MRHLPSLFSLLWPSECSYYSSWYSVSRDPFGSFSFGEMYLFLFFIGYSSFWGSFLSKCLIHFRAFSRLKIHLAEFILLSSLYAFCGLLFTAAQAGFRSVPRSNTLRGLRYGCIVHSRAVLCICLPRWQIILWGVSSSLFVIFWVFYSEPC